jgi:hypothetical protein
LIEIFDSRDKDCPPKRINWDRNNPLHKHIL